MLLFSVNVSILVFLRLRLRSIEPISYRPSILLRLLHWRFKRLICFKNVLWWADAVLSIRPGWPLLLFVARFDELLFLLKFTRTISGLFDRASPLWTSANVTCWKFDPLYSKRTVQEINNWNQSMNTNKSASPSLKAFSTPDLHISIFLSSMSTPNILAHLMSEALRSIGITILPWYMKKTIHFRSSKSISITISVHVLSRLKNSSK